MATHTATSPITEVTRTETVATNVDRRANNGRKQTKPWPLLVGPDTVAMDGTDRIQASWQKLRTPKRVINPTWCPKPSGANR